jgi:hypothetical protein
MADDKISNPTHELKTGVIWVTHCEDQETYSVILHDDMSFKFNITSYDDSSCQSKLTVVIVSGRYKLTGSSIEDGGANKIDLIYSSSTMAIYRESWVKDYNQTKVYGYEDWMLGVPKNIMGRLFDLNSTPNTSSLFSLYKVEGKKMYLGYKTESNDGTSQEKRHIKLDINRIYYMQEK